VARPLQGAVIDDAQPRVRAGDKAMCRKAIFSA
jgi:hypothetical protein